MRVTILFLVYVALATDTVYGTCSNNVTVQVSTGSYTGLIDPEFPNTRQFRAIPFAEPPIASRRWVPPQKLSASPSEHHYAMRFSLSCPQFVSALVKLYSTDLTKGNLIYNGFQNDTSGLVGEATSEDCLYVAVWTPMALPPPGGFPVLFFMTGGGWTMGGIDIPWQTPTSWVERSQSHIVVSINYRMNIFGCPSARGLPDDQQNLGILDQRAALEWTRDNIAAFDGNPDRITHMGRSAGAFATDFHSYAFHEDPIAQGYYLQSGTALGPPPAPPSYSNFSFVAQHVGCATACGDEIGAAELDCMRQVPFAMIENFIGQYGDRGEMPALAFKRVVDEHIVFANYTARSEAGLIARVPMIISNTANEFSALAPWPVDNLTVGPYQPPITDLDVARFVCPTFSSTMYRNRLDIPVFRFQHAGTFPNLNKYDWLGAYHASDIPIFFGTYHLLDGVADTTQFEIDVSQAMKDHVLAFIKDPYNGPQETMGWHPMVVSDPNGGDLVRFGADGKVSQHIDGVEVDGVCLGLREYDPFP